MARKDRYITGGRLLRQGFWDLLGISTERIIWGNVLADIVWLPRSTRCNEPLASAMEQRLLSSRLIAAAKADVAPAYSDTHVEVGGGVALPVAGTEPTVGAADSAASAGVQTEVAGTGADKQLRRPLLVIQHRVCLLQEECAKTWREFDEPTQQRVTRAFQAHFGDNYRIIVVSSANTQLMSCIACQIRLYRQADVLVGLHGAGLTHIMFMKPGAVLVEVCAVGAVGAVGSISCMMWACAV